MLYSLKKYMFWGMFMTGMMGLYAQTQAEKMDAGIEKAGQAYSDVKALVDSGKYSFEADRAFAIGGSSVSVVNISNYLKVNGGATEALLPFFGEIRSGNGLMDSGEIRFNGAIEKYKVRLKDKKSNFIISFIARNTSERFDITLMVNYSGWSTLIVKSIDRNSISYHGKLKPLQED